MIISLCQKIITYSFYLLFILVPLIFTPWNYELFEFNKMIITYAFTIIISAAWITKMARERKIYIKRTPLDIPIFLFVISQFISSLFSIDPHVSWFGYYSRFNSGMLSVFCYVILFYAFVTNWKGRPDRLLIVMLGTGFFVSLYGILQRLGIDKHLWVQDVQNRVFSTLGQPNWLAAYLVGMMPIALHFSFKNTTIRSYVFAILYGMFFLTLLFTRSRSGILACFIVLFLFMLFRTLSRAWTKQSLIMFCIIHIVLGIFMFFNGSHIDQMDRYFSYRAIQNHLQPKSNQNQQPEQSQPSAPLLEFGGTESGKIRQYVWQAAITAWRSTQKTFFIGTGTETFAFAFFQHKPIEHNLTSEWDFLYNKAHNEYLNYLATTGIFGLLAYLAFLGMFTAKSIKHFYFVKRDNSNNKMDDLPLIIALFCGWISLLITNFFGFSVVITQLFLFLFPAFILSIRNDNQESHFSISLPRIVSNATGVVGTIIGTVGILFVGIMWIGDYFFTKGYRLSRAGRLTEGYIQLVQATSLRPREPLYYDELSLALGSLAVASMEAGNATAASELAEKSLLASNISLSTSPNNVNFWKTRTKIYFGFANIDKKFIEAAKNSLIKAQSLSPNDPKISYNLAVLDGRLGNNEQAIETLKKTIAMKPNYRDPYYALYVFYKEVNQPNLATSVITEYLQKVDPNDQEFQNLLKQ